MLKKNEADEWVLTYGRYKGKSLEWVVENDSHWLIEYAFVACDDPADIIIADAALRDRSMEQEAMYKEIDEAIPQRL